MNGAEAVRRHLDWCRERNLSPTTIRQRGHALGRLRRYVEVDLLAVTESDMSAWWSQLSTTNRAESRACQLMHVRQFFRWCVLHDLLDVDPSRKIVRPRVSRRLPRPISEDGLTRAIDDAPEPVRSWLILAAYAGLRACEIASLRAEDITHEGLDASLFVTRGKGGKQRIVPVSARVLEVLPASLSGPMWVDSTGRPFPPHRVSQITNRWLHAHGHPETLHRFRHRFGTVVYRRSRDLRLTQELLGHSSPATTAGYAAWASSEARDVVGLL